MGKRTPEEVLQSVIADVNAMRTKDPEYFGPFEYRDFAEDGEVSRSMGGENIAIYWPNLEILVNEAEALFTHRCIRSTTGDKIKTTGVDGEVYEGPESECPFCHPSKDEAKIASLLARLEDAGFEDGSVDQIAELDDLVDDLVSKQATTINNGGIEAQVRFLLEAGAESELEQLIQDQGNAGGL